MFWYLQLHEGSLAAIHTDSSVIHFNPVVSAGNFNIFSVFRDGIPYEVSTQILVIDIDLYVSFLARKSNRP